MQTVSTHRSKCACRRVNKNGWINWIDLVSRIPKGVCVSASLLIGPLHTVKLIDTRNSVVILNVIARTTIQKDNAIYVDIIQVHDIEYSDLKQVIEETIPALRRVQGTGKATFIGVTGYPLAIFQSVLNHVNVDTILSYNHYSSNDTTLLGLLPFIQESGAGVINLRRFCRGFSPSAARLRGTPRRWKYKESVWKRPSIAKRKAKPAVQFSVRNPRITTTLVGTADPGNLRRNLDWVEEPFNEGLVR